MNAHLITRFLKKISLTSSVLSVVAGILLLTAGQVMAQEKQYFFGGGIGAGDMFAGKAPFPLHVFLEKPFGKNITGGVFLSYGREKYEDFYSGGYYDRYVWSSYRIAARANYSFNELLKLSNDNLDVYGGAMIGFRYGRLKNEDNFSGYSGTISTLGSIAGSGFFSGIHVGVRYGLTPNVKVYGELGRSVSWLKAGLVTVF